jgi:hypothetical protein
MRNIIQKLGLMKFTIWVMAFVVCIFCFISIFITSICGDEQRFHFPLAHTISFDQMVAPDSNYSSAYTPLPYFIGKIALSIVDSVIVLRLLNFFVFIILICFFYLIAKRICGDYLLITLLCILNPYMLSASYLFLPMNWGLMFVMIGLYIYFFRAEKQKNAAHLFFALSVLSQQWMVVVVFSIFLYELGTASVRKDRMNFLIKSLLQKMLCLLPSFCLFFIWRGLTHPNFRSHALQPNFENFDAVLANLGFVLVIPVLWNFKAILKRANVILLFLLPLLWLSIPKPLLVNSFRLTTGFISKIAVKMHVSLNIPYKLTMFVLIISGLVALAILFNKKEEGLNGVLKYSVFGFLMAFIASTRLSASNILICLPFVLLLFHPEIGRSEKSKFLIVVQYFLFGFLYVLYVIFFRSKGMMLI